MTHGVVAATCPGNRFGETTLPTANNNTKHQQSEHNPCVYSKQITDGSIDYLQLYFSETLKH